MLGTNAKSPILQAFDFPGKHRRNGVVAGNHWRCRIQNSAGHARLAGLLCSSELVQPVAELDANGLEVPGEHVAVRCFHLLIERIIGAGAAA